MTDLFKIWLKQELLPNLNPGQALILDVESHGCEILYLPPYSTALNPIEKYWANMKTKMREVLPTVATLSKAIDLAVLSMSI